MTARIETFVQPHFYDWCHISQMHAATFNLFLLLGRTRGHDDDIDDDIIVVL
jgi:hypothetical protein